MPPSPPLQTARPTIEVAGQAQSSLTANLLRMNVLQNVSGLHRGELVFKNWGPLGPGKKSGTGFFYFDRSLLDFGKALAVKLPTGTLMDGNIVGLGGNYPSTAPPEVSVIVEDRFAGLRTECHTNSYENVRDADLVQLIAARHGLIPVVEYQGPTYKAVAQVDESDLCFLRARARLCNAELWLAGTQLHFKARSANAPDVLTLAYGSSLTTFNVSADISSQPTRVIATAWDVAGKQVASATATDSLLASSLHGGTSGAQIATTQIGPRTLVAALATASPQARAESVFRSYAQRFVVGQGSAAADARIAPGATIKLIGLGPLFSGHYYVSEVTHSFDLQFGAITNFTAESAAIGQTQ